VTKSLGIDETGLGTWVKKAKNAGEGEQKPVVVEWSMRLIGLLGSPAVVIGAGQVGAVGLGRVLWLPDEVAWGSVAKCDRPPPFLMCACGVSGGCGQPRASHDRCGREVSVDVLTLTDTG
jgi:hypothetical protein